jgi:hypothetical protein
VPDPPLRAERPEPLVDHERRPEEVQPNVAGLIPFNLRVLPGARLSSYPIRQHTKAHHRLVVLELTSATGMDVDSPVYVTLEELGRSHVVDPPAVVVLLRDVLELPPSKMSASTACGDPGRPSRKPWARSQPSDARDSSCSAVSTPLVDHDQPEGVRRADDGRDDGVLAGGTRQALDERAVDLDDRRLQTPMRGALASVPSPLSPRSPAPHCRRGWQDGYPCSADAAWPGWTSIVFGRVSLAPDWISIRRGLAVSATGIARVRTPSSKLATILSTSRC